MLTDKASYRSHAIVYASFFGYFTLMVLISIIQSIRVEPGEIPRDREWDIVTDSQSESSDEESRY